MIRRHLIDWNGLCPKPALGCDNRRKQAVRVVPSLSWAVSRTENNQTKHKCVMCVVVPQSKARQSLCETPLFL
jgi:predicted cupin superfamily sugar epimerase